MPVVGNSFTAPGSKALGEEASEPGLPKKEYTCTDYRGEGLLLIRGFPLVAFEPLPKGCCNLAMRQEEAEGSEGNGEMRIPLPRQGGGWRFGDERGEIDGKLRS